MEEVEARESKIVEEDVLKKEEQQKSNIEENIPQNSETAQPLEEEVKTKNEPEPVDGKISIRISGNKLMGYLGITGPLHGGKYPTLEEIKESLANHNIVYGILEEKLVEIVTEQKAGEFLVAEGVKMVPPSEGHIEELYSREKKIQFVEGKDKSINFKELGMIQYIQAEGVISRLHLPVEGVSGTNILGEDIPPPNPKPLDIVGGENTHYNEDGTELRATIDGSLSFKKNSFMVESLYVIEGNVDISSGNIKFPGDILVKGDIYEGYSVTSEQGNITVQGAVAGGDIYCKGDLFLNSGVNGGFKGKIVCDGNLTSKFIQNCNVICKGWIKTGFLIHSTIVCDESISVKEGKGIIAGGNYQAGTYVTCKQIGTKGNILTTFTLGLSYKQQKEKKQLEQDLQKLQEEEDQIEKNITYIQNKLKNVKDNPEATAIVAKITKQKPINLMLQQKTQKKLEKFHQDIQDGADSYVEGSKIYPPVMVTMGKLHLEVKHTEYTKFRISKVDDVLQVQE